MKPFYISFGGGFGGGCTIVYAMTARGAVRYITHELGAANGPYHAREAIAADIAWVKGFGGIIHREPIEPVKA